MSTEFGSIKDCVNSKLGIEVATGVGGIKIVFFDSNSEEIQKRWLDKEAAEKLVELIETASYSQWGQ